MFKEDHTGFGFFCQEKERALLVLARQGGLWSEWSRFQWLENDARTRKPRTEMPTRARITFAPWRARGVRCGTLSAVGIARRVASLMSRTRAGNPAALGAPMRGGSPFMCLLPPDRSEDPSPPLVVFHAPIRDVLSKDEMCCFAAKNTIIFFVVCQ